MAAVRDVEGKNYRTALGCPVDIPQPIIMSILGRSSATVTHLGGLLNFQVGFSDYDGSPISVAGKIMGDDEEIEEVKRKDIKLWNPFVNNIYISVRNRDNKDVLHEFSFPNPGEAPMMIAVPQGVKWMKERKAIDQEWFGYLKEAQECVDKLEHAVGTGVFTEEDQKTEQKYIETLTTANAYRDAK